MNKYEALTAQKARTLLCYDHETGVITWKVDRSHNANRGDIAGVVRKGGYRIIRVSKRPYFAHQLAWLLYYGEWPSGGEIDHKNRQPSDCRIVNLRIATHSQNMANRPTKPSKTGVRGVHKHGTKYRAVICVEKKITIVGSFGTLAEAAEARKKAAFEKYGEFAP